MYYNLESLIKMGGLAHVDVPLKMTPRIANAVKKALKNGICEARSGQAATYLAILSDKFEIPLMAFSKNGKYWSSLYFKHLPETTHEGLSDWWKADRVAYRLEKPETWNKFVSDAEDYKRRGLLHYYAKDVLDEPHWGDMNGSKYTVRIMGTKSLDSFEHIAQVYTNTADYQAKIDKVIQLIDEGATIHVTSDKLN